MPKPRGTEAKPKTRKPSAKKTAASDRTHPELWHKIKNKWHQGPKGGQKGVWNARKAQLAVQEYKKKSQEIYSDSGYRTKKPSKSNTLVKWTKEDWGYVSKREAAKKGTKGDGRYLPKKVREQLTAAEKRKENAAKRGKKGQIVPYSGPVLEKMRAAGVLAPKKPRA